MLLSLVQLRREVLHEHLGRGGRLKLDDAGALALFLTHKVRLHPLYRVMGLLHLLQDGA